MSVQAMAWVYANQFGSPARKAVMLALANHCDQQGYCFPAQETIALETELGERTVRRALSELEQAGFIMRKARRKEKDSRGHQAYDSDAIWIAWTLKGGFQPFDPAARLAGRSDLPANAAATQRPERPPNHHIEPSRERESPRTVRSRLPEDWQPSAQDIAYAQSKGLSLSEIQTLAEKHREFWTSFPDGNVRALRPNWARQWQEQVDRQVFAAAPAATPHQTQKARPHEQRTYEAVIDNARSAADRARRRAAGG